MCEEHRRLLDAYKKAACLFRDAVDALSDGMGTTTEAEYLYLCEYAEQARQRSEQERKALDRHIHEHGCRDMSMLNWN